MEYNFLAIFAFSIWSSLVWVVFGFVAALIAKAIMPGKDPGGFIVTAIIGIVGALIGGAVSTFIGIESTSDGVSFFSISDWIFSILGALLVLFVWKKVIAPRMNK